VPLASPGSPDRATAAFSGCHVSLAFRYRKIARLQWLLE
jgi:hypothetical protein